MFICLVRFGGKPDSCQILESLVEMLLNGRQIMETKVC